MSASVRIGATVACLAVALHAPLPARAGEDAAIGRALFRRAWVPAPSATRANDGLGPHFDARSCEACHPGGDRPALAPNPSGELPRGMIVRLARDDGSPDPVYGAQLQGEAVTGLAPEARLRLDVVGEGDGVRYRVEASELGDGPLATDTALSLRFAPSLFAARAIEAVPEDAIRALADPADRDGDGISGRLSEIAERDGRLRVGRWGFRATGLDLADQTAAAFSDDMGLSTARRPDPYGDCGLHQTACRAAPAGSPDSAGEHEIDEAIVVRIAAFLGSLERPDVVEAPPPSPRGAALFSGIGCASCHAPLRGDERTIHSDLLLHDMGPGLAAGNPSNESAREWRTTPLIGLAERLRRGLPLLHDGRARTLSEAVAWHDGEAAPSRRRHAALGRADRSALRDHLAALGSR